jgi:DNA mismatch repair protein MutL
MLIERLPQSVADAIAAGEVVERPASVVKELVENAVDAGARRIHVEVDRAGTVRIRVVDDGAGIAAAELALAVARHATSKLRSASDLEAVATLGFRGEALASIAAVSDMTLCSRTATAADGARLHVRNGDAVEEGTWGGPVGTTIEVLDLFAATPARLRFLRSERAEAAAALAVLTDLVLMRPDLAVTCTIDGRARLRSAGGSLDEALRCVFGREAAELLPVVAEGDINVGGAISEPRRHRAARSGLVVAVNGRRVHNRALIAAVGDAYRGLVPAGRYPFGVVSVALDAAEVDVNVHPTKREVRFRDERGVFVAVQRACWEALRGAAVYSVALPGSVGSDGARAWATASTVREEPAVRTASTPGWEGPSSGENVWSGAFGGADPGHDGGGEVTPPSAIAGLGPLRALGQQQGRWLLASSPRGVVIVDPHAAHEKVLYAELLAAWAAGSSVTQFLLLPALIDCDSRRLDLFTTHEDVVATCGFVVEPFGPATLRCTAVPAGAVAADPARLLTELLDTLAGGPATEQRHRAAALIACHSAVRFGDELAADAQQHLLDRLVATTGGLTCPHGRPAITLVDEASLRRIFRRPPE